MFVYGTKFWLLPLVEYQKIVGRPQRVEGDPPDEMDLRSGT